MTRMALLWCVILAASSVCCARGTLPSQRLDQVQLYFESNLGQSDDRVRFIGRSLASAFLLMTDGSVTARNGVVVRLRGAAKSVDWCGDERLPGVSSYLLGNDSLEWTANVPHYRRVIRKSAYPGIDVVYYGANQRQLEYDFVVAPGADPARIEIAFEGLGELRTDSDGDLMAGGGMVQRRPRAYQKIRGERVEIRVDYRIQSDSVTLQLGPYDRRSGIGIDPLLVFP